MLQYVMLLLVVALLLVEESAAILRKPRRWRSSTKRPAKLPESGRRIRKHAQLSKSTLSEPYASSCNELYFEQRLDHFSGAVAPDGTSTFMQRYFVCGEDLFGWSANDPIFFYCGNEANVEDYVEFTGLMWESASDYNALLVFAEHRYYGDSMPWSEDEIYGDISKLKYAKIDQALEDYAVLIRYLKSSLNSPDSAIIGFGGSYGGMLATWFRMKYPQYMDGAIAGSAPILQINGLTPDANAYGFAAVETQDASMETLEQVSKLVSEEVQEKYSKLDGAKTGLSARVESETCQNNLQTSWDVIEEMSETESGRTKLAQMFNLCTTPSDASTASELVYVVEEAIAYMAMSSFAYESSYITQAVLGTSEGGLPAYPVSYACNEYLSQDLTSDDSEQGRLALIAAVAGFNAVFWNADGSDTCIDLDTIWDSFDDYLWDFLYCDSLLMPSGTLGGDADMFWNDEWDVDGTVAYCNEYYGIDTDVIGGAAVKYGGYDLYKSLSNVVFSNGDMDPWYPGGVLPSMTDVLGDSDSLVSVLIEYNGHHADLMFSDETDSESLLSAREIEREQISKWIEEANAKSSIGMCKVEQTLWQKLRSTPFISAMNIVL